MFVALNYIKNDRKLEINKSTTRIKLEVLDERVGGGEKHRSPTHYIRWLISQYS